MTPLELLEFVIEHHAAENVELRERCAGLEADVGTYRLIALAALDALQTLTVRQAQLQERHARLSDEYRELREQLLLEAAA